MGSSSTGEQIQWTGGPPKPARRLRGPADFLRSPTRVLLLGFFASLAYYWWWMWQLFLFARRERFPRARAFWWILVPIYGWVVIYRTFDDLDDAARRINRSGVAAGWSIALLVLANWLTNISNRLTGVIGLVVILISFVAAAVVFFLVQRSANDYIAGRYSDAKPAGLTWGEITASIIRQPLARPRRLGRALRRIDD